MTIIVAPSSIELSEKETAQFNATANGINKLNFMYKWKKQGSNSLPPKVSGVDNTLFTIPDLHISDQGDYYCTVTNEWNRMVESYSVTLTVKGKYAVSCCVYACYSSYIS